MTVDVLEAVKFVAALIAVVILSYSGHSSEAAMVGLIGVLGTFKGRSAGTSDATVQTLADKVPPATGDAADAKP